MPTRFTRRPQYIASSTLPQVGLLPFYTRGSFEAFINTLLYCACRDFSRLYSLKIGFVETQFVECTFQSGSTSYYISSAVIKKASEPCVSWCGGDSDAAVHFEWWHHPTARDFLAVVEARENGRRTRTKDVASWSAAFVGALLMNPRRVSAAGLNAPAISWKLLQSRLSWLTRDKKNASASLSLSRGSRERFAHAVCFLWRRSLFQSHAPRRISRSHQLRFHSTSSFIWTLLLLGIKLNCLSQFH